MSKSGWNPRPLLLMTSTSNNTDALTVATKTVNLQQMIAAGAYGYVSPYVSDKYFGPEALIVGGEPKLFDVHAEGWEGFDGEKQIEKAAADLEARGYKFASLGDLLDYGAKHPEDLREQPILALGSIAKLSGWREVAALSLDSRNPSSRQLTMWRIEGESLSFVRLLAVRE